MPFVDPDQPSAVLPRTGGGFEPPAPTPAPDTGDVFAAAFRRENIIGSLIAGVGAQKSFDPVPGYNAFQDPQMLTSTYLDSHGERFVGVRSPQEAKSILSKIEREIQDQRTIEAGGVTGFFASTLMSMVDPTILIPGGAAVRSARLGERLAGSAASVGAGAAIGTAVQETALQATQNTRTMEESAMSVAAATVLGGAIGTAIGGMSKPAARTLGAALAGEIPVEPRMVPLAGGGARSVGAEAVDAADTALKQGWGGATLSRWTSFMGPLQRMQNSEAGASRAGALQLADPGGVRIAANTEEGGSRAAVPGGSVEIRSRAQIDSFRAEFAGAFDQAYADYFRANGGGGKIAQAMNSTQRAAGRQTELMTPSEFAEAVATFERTGGEAIEAVKQVANTYRTMQKQIEARMKEAGIIEEEFGPAKFAQGYVTRIFVPKAVAAKAREFKDVIFGNMKADQERKALLQGEASQLSADYKGMTEAEKRLARARLTTSRQARDVDQRMGEVQTFANRGQSRYEAAQARVFDMNTEITELENTLARAREDKAYSARDLKALEKELNVLRRARDKALAAAEKEPKAPATETTTVPKYALPAGVNPRRVVDYVTEQRAAPIVPKKLGFVQWVIDQGGLADTGGDVASIYGRGSKIPKGLIREGGLELDELGKRYGEHIGRETYLEGRVGNLYDDDIAGLIERAIDGENPDGWPLPRELQNRLDEWELAVGIREDMAQKGLDPSKKGDVIAYLRSDDPNALPGRAAGPDDEALDSLLDDPIYNFRGADERTAGVKADVKNIAKDIDRLRKQIQAREKTEARQIGGRDEARVNARASRSRLEVLLDRAERIAAEDSRLARDLDKLSKDRLATREKLEGIVTRWEGDTTKSAQRALAKRAELEKARQEKIDLGEYEGTPKRLRSADKEVDSAIRKIVESDRAKSDAELRTQASEIVNNLMSNGQGRLAYEWGATANKDSRAILAARGDMPKGGEPADIPYLRERKLPVTDAQLVELGVVENDIRTVFNAYVHSAVPQVEMARMFEGDVSGSMVIRQIKEEYQPKIEEAKTPKEALRLRKQMNQDISDFTNMRDRILGTYAIPENPEGFFHRAATVVKQFNFLSKLGSMVFAQVADAGSIVMRGGLGGAAEGLSGALNKLAKDQPRASKAEMQLIRDAGVATEMMLGSRAMQMSEILTDYGRLSKFERGMQAATEGMSYLNLSRQWDTSMQTAAGISSLRRMMRGIESWATQGATKDAEWLAQLNIGENEARRIWTAATAGEGERLEGVLIPEGRSWADPEAYDMVRFALRQAVDSTIIKPGQEKPLVMSTQLGSVVGQFRSFLIASHQRILIAGLQQADQNMAQGVVTMLSLGMLSVALADLSRDGQLKEREAGEWFVEGLDRAGLTGWLMEANNMAEKISGQKFGLRPLGGQEPASRFASRSLPETLLGPTFGFMVDAGQATKSILTGEVERSNIKAIRNQIPGQNLFWLRYVFNEIQRATEDAFGIPEVAQRRQ